MRFARIIIAFAVLVAITIPARAVVNQVTGQVVPIQKALSCPGEEDKCIQSGLDFGEGLNPPDGTYTSPIDAVLDAKTTPQTYLVPKDSTGKYVKVTFRLIQEGANYENIFGWYNVGSHTKRYPVILSCPGKGSTMYKTIYEPPKRQLASPWKWNGGYSYTVDFEAEYLGQRYTGGQIGFYLVTPEGSKNVEATGNASLCATDPNDQGNADSNYKPIDDDASGSFSDGVNEGFGRVYYTESKLNNDGNYIHYLIYQSKKTPTNFYFGFEDLFRGGDNDFDDTLVKLEGLVPACVPTLEICNGKDDNCNGTVDEKVTRKCSNKCGSGTESCKFTNDGNPNNDWLGCTAPKAALESCNGKDDDCDKIPDNNLGTLPSCTLGGCSGTMKCITGTLTCDAPPPSTEICDGKDNDCDTKIDENVTRTCSTKCGSGIETCKFIKAKNPDDNWIGCTAPTPGTETCDGLDNDCDGTVDNNVTGEGTKCDAPASEGNTCKQGATKCVGGVLKCVGYQLGTVEICDNKDNDCDGKVDEDNPCPTGMKCITGWCRANCTGLEFGCPTGYLCKGGYCLPDKCAEVTCKGDEKCSGGKCINLCANVTCKTTEVCVLGECVSNDCYFKSCSTKGELCINGKCQPNPCAKVSCKKGEFCEKGICKPSCGAVMCGKGGRCLYGKCVTNLCAEVTCASGTECVNGKCDEKCGEQPRLKGGRLCVQGQKLDHPCKFVKCFNGEKCPICPPHSTCIPYHNEVDGQCISDTTYRGTRDRLVVSSGGLMCDLAAGTPAPPGLLLLLMIGGAVLVARRRRS